ncbi:cytochrome c oxidase subunit II [Croceibacterium xixiisoli]|nr:cytochrome c oxidase subunit II [Croceibacterium xixiisoli]
MSVAVVPQVAMAAPAPAAPVTAEVAPATPAAGAPAAEAAAAPTADAAAATTAEAAAPAYQHLGPEWIKGQPHAKGITFQDQYSPNGHYAQWMHDYRLLPIIIFMSVFVLLLLLWVMFRYNRKSNPVPSKTSHNTLIEIIWTAVPVLVLVVIAIPSMTLLSRQYKSPPEDAVTIKAIGYQWYWGYEYPDNGGFEVISNMMPEEEAKAKGFPTHLEVDNRMVVPVGEKIRLQTFGADVIHSFAVPSLWFKLDAVPGRINERELFISEPGIYYGQCSELCGARHGYMPIAIEAVPRPQFEAWVLSQGGTVGNAEAEAPAAAAPAAAAPAAEAPAAGESPAAAPAAAPAA